MSNLEVEIEEQDAINACTDFEQQQSMEMATLKQKHERPIFQIGEETVGDEMLTEENSNNSDGTLPASLGGDALEKLSNNTETNGVDLDETSPNAVFEPDSVSLTEGGDSSSSKTKVKTPSRSTLAADVTHISVHPSDIFEYEWPQKSGDRFFIQEQISELLGISSFKRKYPEMFRRTIEPQERDYLLKVLKINIALPSHHLTALQSVDVHELMSTEYPDIYAAYQKAYNERQRQTMLEKQKELEAIKMDAKKLAELRQKAIKSAFEFNSDLQAVRRLERTKYWDLNTNIIHSPISQWIRLSKEHTKPSKYPVFCLPGQYTTYYKKFDPSELRHMPLNTVLEGHNQLFPPKKEHSPPPIIISDEEMAAASKAAESPRTPKNEPSPPTPITSGGITMEGERGTKRIKREPPEPKSPQQKDLEPPPPKLRKMSTTSSSNNNKKIKLSLACPKLPPIPVSRVPASPKIAAIPSPKNNNQQQPPPPAAASASTTPIVLCSICQLSDASPHTKAQLVRCSACHQQMHSSCIDMPLSMVHVIRQYDWLCIDCKRCCVCEQPDQEAAMMCCDQCDRGYHTFCIGLDQPPNGTWHCPECKDQIGCKKFLDVKDNLKLGNNSIIANEKGEEMKRKRGRPPKKKYIRPD